MDTADLRGACRPGGRCRRKGRGTDMENSIRSVMEYAVSHPNFDKITFSRCRDREAHIVRAEAKPFLKRGAVYVQIETFCEDGRALHRNLPAGEAAEVLTEMAERLYRQTNLHTPDGDCEIRFSKKEQCHIANGIRETAASASPAVRLQTHNRQRRYLLETENGAAPRFLYDLGITDEGGRVLDKKRPKYRQINRFLELVDDIYDTFPREGVLTVYDLCCGKSYLTFAVYYYFTVLRGREVRMHGVDLKPDVIAYCNETAASLGFSSLTFSCGNINDFTPEAVPDLVISLHACDIATDIVLANAVRWGARAVLSTPCCHHEMFHTMDAPSLSFITEHSMLKQKLCDAATDALRCLFLEIRGYDVQTLELIDPEETPKNLMIRARLRTHPRSNAETDALRSRYDAACALLGCEPYLKQEL